MPLELEPTSEARAAIALSAGLGHKPLEQSTPAEARAAFSVSAQALKGTPDDVAEVSSANIGTPAGQIGIRCYRGLGAPPARARAIVYFHGGGWVLGDLESHDDVCRWLANAASSVVVSVEYRLAPEHPFPAGLSDACAAVRYVHAAAEPLGIDPARLTVAGDSAGGNLAAVTALLSRDGDLPPIDSQILIYPNTDLLADYPSRRRFADGYGFTASEMAWFATHYAAAGDPADWRMSPLRASSFLRLPRTVLAIAELDLLADEGLAYGEAIRAAGGEIAVLKYPRMIHGFASMGRLIPQARALFDDVASALTGRAQPGAEA